MPAEDGSNAPVPDASGALAVAVLSIVVVAAGVVIRSDGILTVISLPLLTFLPGYALLAYVHAGRAPESATEPTASRPFDSRGRFLATAVGVSLLVVTAVGLALVPVGGSLLALVAIVGGVTVALCAAAIRGTESLSRTDFAPEFGGSGIAADRGSLAIVGLTALLLVGVGLTAVGPAAPDAERFTEFYLLEPTEEGGAIVHDATIDPDEGAAFLVGIENHERERTNYTVVAQFQRTRLDRTERLVRTPAGPTAVGNHTATPASDEDLVVDRRELHRFRADLAHNETRRIEHSFVPPEADNRSRVVYLLYRGDPPAEPTRENAYRSLAVWDEWTDPDTVIPTADR